MTLNFWFINPLATWLTWVLVSSPATNICRTSTSSYSWRNSSSASKVVSPPASTTAYGWLCYKCTFQWCLHSVESVFMIGEWILQLINSKCWHVCVFFQGHKQVFKYWGKTSENFFNNPLVFYGFSMRYLVGLSNQQLWCRMCLHSLNFSWTEIQNLFSEFATWKSLPFPNLDRRSPMCPMLS